MLICSIVHTKLIKISSTPITNQILNNPKLPTQHPNLIDLLHKINNPKNIANTRFIDFLHKLLTQILQLLILMNLSVSISIYRYTMQFKSLYIFRITLYPIFLYCGKLLLLALLVCQVVLYFCVLESFVYVAVTHELVLRLFIIVIIIKEPEIIVYRLVS